MRVSIARSMAPRHCSTVWFEVSMAIALSCAAKLSLDNFGPGRCAVSNRASFDAALMFERIRTSDDDIDEFDTGPAGDLAPTLARDFERVNGIGDDRPTQF
jgi:hypothetical protein